MNILLKPIKGDCCCCGKETETKNKYSFECTPCNKVRIETLKKITK